VLTYSAAMGNQQASILVGSYLAGFKHKPDLVESACLVAVLCSFHEEEVLGS